MDTSLLNYQLPHVKKLGNIEIEKSNNEGVLGPLNKNIGHIISNPRFDENGDMVACECNCTKIDGVIYHPIKNKNVLYEYNIRESHISTLEKFGVDKWLQIIEE